MWLKILKKCGDKMEKITRLCNQCKKPMFNSWAGEWVNGKFIEIHTKCKEEWKATQSKNINKANNLEDSDEM